MKICDVLITQMYAQVCREASRVYGLFCLTNRGKLNPVFAAPGFTSPISARHMHYQKLYQNALWLLQKDEFLRLIINSIRNDLISRNEAFQCLALSFIGNGQCLQSDTSWDVLLA